MAQRRKWWSTSLLLLLALPLACQNGQTGGCADQVPGVVAGYTYPTNPTLPGGDLQYDIARFRISNSMFEFMTSHISDIVATYLPTYIDPISNQRRAVYFLPGALNDECYGPTLTSGLFLRDGCRCDGYTGDSSTDEILPEYCQSANKTYRSRLEFNLDDIDSNLTFDFEDYGANAARINITLRDIDLYVNMAAAWVVNLGILSTNGVCYIRGASDGLGGEQPLFHLTYLKMSFELAIEDGADGHKVLRIKVADNSELNIADWLNFSNDLINADIDPCLADSTGTACNDTLCNNWGCNTVCTTANVITQIISVSVNILSGLIEGLAPMLIDWIGNAVINGIGDIPIELDVGIDPSKIVSQISGSESLAGIFPDINPIGMKYFPNDNAFQVNGQDARAGLNVVFDGGMTAERSSCVPYLEPPMYSLLQPDLPDFNGQVSIVNEHGVAHLENYDLVFALSQSMLAQAAYAIVQSGTLCITMDSDQIGILAQGMFTPTAGLFATLAPEINYLAEPDAPVLMSLRPTTVPTFTIGGRSLLTMSIKDFDLTFFLFTEDRYARMFTMLVDVQIGLSLEPTADNQLKFMIDRIDIGNFRQTFNDLAPHADLSSLIQSLLEMTLGSLLQQELTFNLDISTPLSQALGMPITMFFNDIRREPVDSDSDDPAYLVMYLTVCDNQDLNDTQDVACYRAGHEGQVPPPPTIALLGGGVDWQSGLPDIYGFNQLGQATGQVVFAATEGYEYKYRVDKGPWHGYRAPVDGQLLVQDGLLRLVGNHVLELGYRRPGNYLSAAPDTIKLTYWVDPIAPKVTAEVDGVNLLVNGSDLGTAADQLSFECRVIKHVTDEPGWLSLNNGVAQCLRQAQGLGLSATLEVRAKDLAGNASTSISLAASAFSPLSSVHVGPVAVEKATQLSGCASIPETSATMWLWVLLCAILLANRGRAIRLIKK